MENASKALLMAGGVLIAVLILALLVRSFTSISKFQISQLTEEEQQQLIAFNEQYTKYAGQYVYGTDVLTLENKYANDGFVKVEIDGERPAIDDNKYNYDSTTNSYSNETKYYKCVSIEYDNTTGRVNKIKFKQIKLEAEGDT